MDDIQTVIDAILAGDFPAAIARARTAPFDAVREQILLRAFDDHNVALYGFYVALLLQSPTPERHYAAAELLAMALNVHPGAYETAAYHARQAVALAPAEPSYQEFLLFLHETPEQPVNDTEAREAARALLQLDPRNEAAQQTIARLDR